MYRAWAWLEFSSLNTKRLHKTYFTFIRLHLNERRKSTTGPDALCWTHRYYWTSIGIRWSQRGILSFLVHPDRKLAASQSRDRDTINMAMPRPIVLFRLVPIRHTVIPCIDLSSFPLYAKTRFGDYRKAERHRFPTFDRRLAAAAILGLLRA